MAPRTARSTRAAAPAKKAPARRPAAPAPAKKSAPPAKKAAPAKKTVAPKAPVEAPKERPATKPKLQSHDVVMAYVAARKAQHVFEELAAAYAAEYGETVDFVVDHTKAVMELDTPKQSGPKRKDGPVRKAMVEEEDSVIGEVFDREKLEYQYSLPELRALFKELLEKDERLTPTLKKLEILKQLEENGYFREEVAADSDEADDEEEEDLGAEDEFEDESDVEDEDDDGDGDAEDDDEEEDDEDEEVLTAEDLDGYTLKQLREVAEENQVSTKGKKEAELREELKALLDAEDEPDDEEDDEEEEDDDEGYLTVDDLPNMDLEELLAVAKQSNLKVPATTAKSAAKMRAFLTPYLEADEDDEEDDDE